MVFNGLSLNPVTWDTNWRILVQFFQGKSSKLGTLIRVPMTDVDSKCNSWVEHTVWKSNVEKKMSLKETETDTFWNYPQFWPIEALFTRQAPKIRNLKKFSLQENCQLRPCWRQWNLSSQRTGSDHENEVRVVQLLRIMYRLQGIILVIWHLNNFPKIEFFSSKQRMKPVDFKEKVYVFGRPLKIKFFGFFRWLMGWSGPKFKSDKEMKFWVKQVVLGKSGVHTENNPLNKLFLKVLKYVVSNTRNVEQRLIKRQLFIFTKLSIDFWKELKRNYETLT